MSWGDVWTQFVNEVDSHLQIQKTAKFYHKMISACIMISHFQRPVLTSSYIIALFPFHMLANVKHVT